MRRYTILRLLFSLFLLYVAWPFLPTGSTENAKLFWLLWLGFFFLVVGGNLASLLRLLPPPAMERKEIARPGEGSRARG